MPSSLSQAQQKKTALQIKKLILFHRRCTWLYSSILSNLRLLILPSQCTITILNHYENKGFCDIIFAPSFVQEFLQSKLVPSSTVGPVLVRSCSQYSTPSSLCAYSHSPYSLRFPTAWRLLILIQNTTRYWYWCWLLVFSKKNCVFWY